MQVAVIEFARSQLNFEDANSSEFDKTTSCPVVIFMPEGSTTEMGGTMRLGARKTIFQDASSLACQLYGGQVEVAERHRHRYEVNPEYISALEKAGLILTGRDETGKRMEVIELPRDVHPFFVGCQYHPELKSRCAVRSSYYILHIIVSSSVYPSYYRTRLIAGCAAAYPSYYRTRLIAGCAAALLLRLIIGSSRRITSFINAGCRSKVVLLALPRPHHPSSAS
jgi:CTP synthase